MRELKIVHVAEAFAGGVFNFINNLVFNLPEHQHTIIYGRRPDTRRDLAGFYGEHARLYYWRNAQREIRPIADFKALLELRRIFALIGSCDVIHLHSSKAGALGRIAAKLNGSSSRTVYSPHGLSFNRQDVGHITHTAYIAIERLAAMLGGRVVASGASECECLHKNKIPAAYINNGVAVVPLPNITYPRTRASIVVGTVGRITAQKNPALFNAIATRFVDEKNVKFVWIGDGELKDRLVAPNIEVKGWIPLEALGEYLATFSLYLSTSQWEGLSLSVLEGMKYSLPLVLANCTGNRDVVKPGINGYLYDNEVEAGEYLKRIMADDGRRLGLGAASRNLVTRDFSLDKMVDSYKRLYYEIAE